MPVLSSDPLPNQLNQVVGFARAKVLSAKPTEKHYSQHRLGRFRTDDQCHPSALVLPPSLLRRFSGARAIQPFVARSYDLGSNTVSPAPFGVVMAPAISPRQIQGGFCDRPAQKEALADRCGAKTHGHARCDSAARAAWAPPLWPSTWRHRCRSSWQR